jgi:hypothetical protein
VLGILNRLSPLTAETQLEKSEIRIFCDNDKRWEKRHKSLGGWGDDIKYAESHQSTMIPHTELYSGMITYQMPYCSESDTGAATYSRAAYFEPGTRGKSPSVGRIRWK